MSTRPPHIIVLISHDTGRHLGCYDSGAFTPSLDALAAAGIRFDAAFASAPQCSPSRASLNSGLSPHRNGMMGLAHLGWSMRPEVPKLRELLAAAGYRTALIGAEHEGVSCMANHGYQEMVDAGAGPAEDVAGRALAFFREHMRADGPPLFASVGFEEAHRPYPEPDESGSAAVNVPGYLPYRDEVRYDLAGLEKSIRRLDEAVGRIAGGLDNTAEAGDTLLIFTTDHGIAFPRAKGTLYDPGIETALLARRTGHIRAGSITGQLVSNVDILPTICELAGAQIPSGLDGVSFADLFGRPSTGRTSGAESEPSRERIFCEITWHDAYAPTRAVRTRDCKYIRNLGPRRPVYLPLDVHRSPSGLATRHSLYADPRPPEELYDLGSDHFEMRNLIADPKLATVRDTLRSELDEWMTSTDDPILRGPVPGTEVPEWAEERLSRT